MQNGTAVLNPTETMKEYDGNPVPIIASNTYHCEVCNDALPEWDCPLLCAKCRQSHIQIAKDTKIAPTVGSYKVEYSTGGIAGRGHYLVKNDHTFPVDVAHVGTWNKSMEQQAVDAAMIAHLEELWEIALDAARKGDVDAAWTVALISGMADRLINEDDE